MTKTGPGTLVLGASSNYAGITTINNGTLRTTVLNAIKTGNAVTVNGRSAGLDIAGTNQTFGTTIVKAGSITNSGAAASLAVGNLTLGGGPAGSTASISVNNLVLNGTVTYDATNNPQTAILGGTIDLNGSARTFTIGDSVAYNPTSNAFVDLDITGAIISSTAGSGITVLGGSTTSGTPNLRLSGANTFDGPITVGNGTNYVILTLNNAQALGSPSTPRITTVSANATLAIGGGISLTNANNTILLTGVGVGSTASSNFITPYPGALVNTSGNNSIGGEVDLSGAAPISVANSADTHLLGNFSPGANGNVMTKVGMGTLRIAGGAADLPITATNGTVELMVPPTPTSSHTLTAAGGTILLDPGVSLSIFNPLSLSGGGVGLGHRRVEQPRRSARASGGALDSRGGNNVVNGAIILTAATTITSQTFGNSLTLQADISGAQSLAIDGAGDVVINGRLGLKR